MITNMLLSLTAKDIEKAAKKNRAVLKEFQQKVIRLLKESTYTLNNESLNLLLRKVPPLRVTNQVIQSSKDILERMDQRDITDDEIFSIASTGIMSNPLDLLQQRRREMIIKHQVDLIRELRLYSRTLEAIRIEALTSSMANESDLFQKQYQFLPSYQRRKVMYGYPLISGEHNYS